MRCCLARDYRFESARSLPHIGVEHPCARLHGHSFLVTLVVEGEVKEDTGWVMDFSVMDKLMAPLLRSLDHRVLNEVEGLDNPTSEHIAGWLWRRVKPVLPELIEVSVAETQGTRCTFRGEF